MSKDFLDRVFDDISKPKQPTDTASYWRKEVQRLEAAGEATAAFRAMVALHKAGR